jgi:glycosyltransferase involved in cell wall biosynthesis
MDYSDKLIAQVGGALSRKEAEHLVRLVNGVLKQGPDGHSGAGILRIVHAGEHTTGFNLLALYINRLSREMSLCKSAANRAPVTRSLLHLREMIEVNLIPRGEEALPQPLDAVEPEAAPRTIEAAIIKVYRLAVRRIPGASEVDLWKKHLDNGLPFHEFLMLMLESPEARQQPRADKLVRTQSSDGEFIQLAYEVVLGRGAASWEITPWLLQLEDRSVTRAGMLAALFETSAQRIEELAAVHDGLSCLIMGTGRHLSATEWHQQAEAMADDAPKPPDARYRNRLAVRGEPRVLVSALASLYRGGDFIEQFLDNITSQDGFDEYCELVIVDADSPENEYEVIKRYLARHRNINYIRMNYRIGIYDAWNVAAKAARGQYLTNTNMDDLRRHDSFMLQAGALDNMAFADVVYQDLYYTFDPRLSFEQIAAFGHETTLPVITPNNMMKFNSPHNAPMWRKRLHDELGYFDIRYRSAGDYEFWMRCLAAGKKFYKLNDPHVVYYQNPDGLSTRPDTRGVAEAMEVTKTYARKLVPGDVVLSREDFIRKLGLSWPEDAGDARRNRYELGQQALRNLSRRGKYRQGAAS